MSDLGDDAAITAMRLRSRRWRCDLGDGVRSGSPTPQGHPENKGLTPRHPGVSVFLSGLCG